MTLTFLDSGPLIALARGESEIAQRVWNLINDPDRTFASSSMVELEVMPKALYHGNHAEAETYNLFFSSVHAWLPVDETLIRRAQARAGKLGLGAMDALHLEAAIALGADEFITTEKQTKPLFRETEVRVKNP